MPYKDKAKQKKYMKMYIVPYMRTYQKHRTTVDRGQLVLVKEQFPEAYELLTRKIKREVDRAMQKPAAETCEGSLKPLRSQETKGIISMSEFEKQKPKLAKQLLAGEDFVTEGDYVYSLSSSKQGDEKESNLYVRFIRKEEVSKAINRFFHADIPKKRQQ
jgi:hypothetical protein